MLVIRAADQQQQPAVGRDRVDPFGQPAGREQGGIVLDLGLQQRDQAGLGFGAAAGALRAFGPGVGQVALLARLELERRQAGEQPAVAAGRHGAGEKLTGALEQRLAGLGGEHRRGVRRRPASLLPVSSASAARW